MEEQTAICKRERQREKRGEWRWKRGRGVKRENRERSGLIVTKVGSELST